MTSPEIRSRSLVLALALALTVMAPRLPGDTLPRQSDPVVNYDISVRLDATQKQLYGYERLTWTNPSTDPVADLWFHLYLNAFRNTKSTFYKESGGRLRGDRMGKDSWGWIDIISMRVTGGPDLTNEIRFEHPDDDNVDDRTVMRVPLPEAVPPGGSVTLDIGFRAQLPQVFARSGYRRDFYLVAQWFPKIGVYEPAGRRGRATGGWNCHQYHASSEYYADYGRYVVAITAPSRFIVGATGVRAARRDNGDGTTTHTYEQADVHDFAWTADPNFVEIKRTFSATRDVTPAEYGRTARMLKRSMDEVRLSDVEITLLMQPLHLPQLERHVDAAKLAIKSFGLWYGRYPYRTLTIVDPAHGARGAAGMEYPTLITAGTSFLLNRWPLDKVRAPEGVTVHELFRSSQENFW